MDLTDDQSCTMSAADLDELSVNLRGRILRHGDPAYDLERRFWNAAHGRRQQR